MNDTNTLKSKNSTVDMSRRQSQNTLLEEVCSWDRQTCQQRLDDILPQLISYISNAEDNIINVLQVLVQSVLPAVSTETLEEKVLSKVTGKVMEQFENILGRLLDATSMQLESVLSDLQLAMELIGCVELCVSDLLSRDTELPMAHIHSLPPLVLSLVHGTYTHCKESGTIYKELLGPVSQQLSALFRKAHSLQMEFISLIDKVIIGSSQDDLQDMSAVIHGICDLSDVATNLDVKIMITIWKTTSRWLCRYKEQLCDWLDIGHMLGSLCRDMCVSYCYTTRMTCHSPQGAEDEEEEKLFHKNVKILGFQMKVLVTLVKEFKDYLGSCVAQVAELILTMQSRVPPCLLTVTIRRDYTDDIERHVTIGIHPLLSYLIPNSDFMACLTTAEQDSKLHLPRCLTLIIVAGMLGKYPDDVRSLWIEPGKTSSKDTQGLPLMTAIFHSLTHCYTEVCLPVKLSGASVAGKPQRAVPLFEFIVTRMCAFAIVNSTQHFQVIESCLLENVFSRNLHSALLAGDIWCFLARNSSAEHCHLQCLLLARLHSTVSPSSAPQCCHLVALLTRMVKLLTLEHQDDFISKFAVSPKTLGLWSVVSVSDLDVSLRHQVADDIVTVCMQVMQDWCQLSTRTVDDAIILENAVLCLTNLFRGESLADYTDVTQRKNTVEMSYDVWQTLSMSFVVRSPVLQNVVASLFSLAAYVQSDLDNKHILQFVRNALACLSHGVGGHVKLAILCFLEHLGAKTLPPTFEQEQILCSLPDLYCPLLADPNIVVHRSALVSFAQFAETTRHESVVPECLHGNDRVQKSVVQYLNQLAGTAPAPDIDRDLLDAQSRTVNKYLTKSTEPQSELDASSSTSHALPSTSQIPLKRFKATSVAETEERDIKYRNILSQLRVRLDDLSTTTDDTPLPSWVRDQLNDIHGQLTTLMRK